MEERTYWECVAYYRGRVFGEGWAPSCDDIPDEHRAAAKDAYDVGVGDFLIHDSGEGEED